MLVLLHVCCHQCDGTMWREETRELVHVLVSAPCKWYTPVCVLTVRQWPRWCVMHRCAASIPGKQVLLKQILARMSQLRTKWVIMNVFDTMFKKFPKENNNNNKNISRGSFGLFYLIHLFCFFIFYYIAYWLCMAQKACGESLTECKVWTDNTPWWLTMSFTVTFYSSLQRSITINWLQEFFFFLHHVAAHSRM